MGWIPYLQKNGIHLDQTINVFIWFRRRKQIQFWLTCTKPSLEHVANIRPLCEKLTCKTWLLCTHCRSWVSIIGTLYVSRLYSLCHDVAPRLPGRKLKNVHYASNNNKKNVCIKRWMESTSFLNMRCFHGSNKIRFVETLDFSEPLQWPDFQCRKSVFASYRRILIKSNIVDISWYLF